MRESVLTQTTRPDGQCAFACASAANWLVPVGAEAVVAGLGAGAAFGAGAAVCDRAGADAGARAGAAVAAGAGAGALAGCAVVVPARQSFTKALSVMPFFLLAASLARHSSRHCLAVFFAEAAAGAAAGGVAGCAAAVPARHSF